MHDVSFEILTISRRRRRRSMPRRMGSTHTSTMMQWMRKQWKVGRGNSGVRVIPAFEFADDLDGLVYGLECEVLVPPMRGQHIALEMLRETTETVV